MRVSVRISCLTVAERPTCPRNAVDASLQRLIDSVVSSHGKSGTIHRPDHEKITCPHKFVNYTFSLEQFAFACGESSLTSELKTVNRPGGLPVIEKDGADIEYNMDVA